MKRFATSLLVLPLVPLVLIAGCDDDLTPLQGTEPPPPVVIPPPVFVETCETVRASESDVTPHALVILDRSGSMNGVAPEFLDTRWNAVVSAVNTMTAAHQGELGFGLMLFPSPRSADFCAAGEVIVAPGLNTAGNIAGALTFTSPGGATPTAATLRAARDFFANSNGDVPAAVILATDGGPNCNAFLDVETCRCVVPGACDLANPAPADEICLDDVATIEAADALHQAGVSTYVIGIPGSEEFGGVLDQVAIAGGTARSLDAGPQRFYPATDAASLASALDAVRVRVEKCQRVVRVDVGLDVAEAESVSVALDGALLTRDETRLEGWDVTSANKIELFGAACDRAVDGAEVEVAVCHLIPDNDENTASLSP
jgi:hypothetical protein